LLAAGAPIDGLGFQGHFSASPTGIPRVKEIYDEFWNAYGLEAKVTEYDIDKLVPAQTQAAYMRDILTITFAHPSMKGFLMWGFWDGAHWTANAPIFREDWSLKPSGEAFISQVFDEWWTNESGFSDANGEHFVRGFKGYYKVSVACENGGEDVQYLWLLNDTTLVFDNICLVGTQEPDHAFGLQVSPTLAIQTVDVQWTHAGAPVPVVLRMSDIFGQVLEEQKLPPTTLRHSFQVRILFQSRVVEGATRFVLLCLEGGGVYSIFHIPYSQGVALGYCVRPFRAIGGGNERPLSPSHSLTFSLSHSLTLSNERPPLPPSRLPLAGPVF